LALSYFVFFNKQYMNQLFQFFRVLFYHEKKIQQSELYRSSNSQLSNLKKIFDDWWWFWIYAHHRVHTLHCWQNFLFDDVIPYNELIIPYNDVHNVVFYLLFFPYLLDKEKINLIFFFSWKILWRLSFAYMNKI